MKNSKIAYGSLSSGLAQQLENEEAKKESRKALVWTLVAGTVLVVTFAVMLMIAISIKQPNVPSKQPAAKGVKL